MNDRFALSKFNTAMSYDIVKAIIALLGAIAGAFFTSLIKVYFDNREQFAIHTSRRKSINGYWVGEALQTHPTQYASDMKFTVTFSGAGKKIIGQGNLKRNDISYTMTLKGYFNTADFIKLEYENRDDQIVQFGSLILKLTSSADTLVGAFLGFGQVAETLVWGKCELKKPK